MTSSINYCNYDNGDEVIISKCSGEQQEVVVDAAAAAAADADVCAQPKQQQSYNNIKYDARFNADEESYAKAYAVAKLAQAQSQKALAEEKALAEVKVVEARNPG